MPTVIVSRLRPFRLPLTQPQGPHKATPRYYLTLGEEPNNDHPPTSLAASRLAASWLPSPSACLLAASAAHADVFGRLRVVARDAAGRPLPGATVVFHDTANVRPDLTVTADAQGVALSPPLEIRAWQVTTTRRPDTKLTRAPSSVLADTSTDVRREH